MIVLSLAYNCQHAYIIVHEKTQWQHDLVSLSLWERSKSLSGSGCSKYITVVASCLSDLDIWVL